MNRIKAEHTIYDNKAAIKLIFDYDAALVARIRQELPVARLSRTMHCWYVENQPQKIAAFQNLGIEVGQKTMLDVIASDDNVGILKRIFLNLYQPKHYLGINNTDVARLNRNYILAKKLSATYQGQFVNAIKLFYEKIPRKKNRYRRTGTPPDGKPVNPCVIKRICRPTSATANIKHKAILSLIWKYKTINRLEIGCHKISTLSPKIPIMGLIKSTNNQVMGKSRPT